MLLYPVPESGYFYLGDDFIVLIDVLTLEGDEQFLAKLEDIIFHQLKI
jgi:hypothetical protein